MRGRGLAALAALVCLAAPLAFSEAVSVGNQPAFGPAALNYSTNASRVYSYFPKGDASKAIGVDVSPYGTIKQVTPATFPFFALAQTPGISQLMFIIKPCAQLAPHHHPRADELLTVIEGGPVTVGMVDEAASGQQAFQLHMNRLDITMIPIGDIHYIENRQCEDAIIVGSFSNTDPGVELTLGDSPHVSAQLTFPSASAQSMLKLPDAQLAASLGMSQNATAAFRATVRAAAAARFQPVQDDGVCRAACNITA